jgi:hypothetical protein
MEEGHVHERDDRCTPACPHWSADALALYRLQRRWAEMLEACRTAAAIEWVLVVPSGPGVVLPEYLSGEAAVRLNLVAGRDAPEVLLDEWGIRCELTFRGRRHDCAFPWDAVMGGELRPPERKRPRFGVIQGGRSD